jgi:regulator of RNase E activity RraA
VIVIPQEIETRVLDEAVAKVSSENMTRDELLQGSLLSEVYAKYGVL